MLTINVANDKEKELAWNIRRGTPKRAAATPNTHCVDLKKRSKTYFDNQKNEENLQKCTKVSKSNSF